MGGKKEQTNSDVNLTHSSFAFTMQKIRAAGSFRGCRFHPLLFLDFHPHSDESVEFHTVTAISTKGQIS